MSNDQSDGGGMGGLELTPKVYRRMSNADLLIEGLADGEKATVAMKKLDDGQRKVLANRLLNSMFRQIFLDGFFHADPTEANVFVKAGKNPTFTFIDWGLHGKISLKQRYKLLKLVGAIAANKPDMVLQTLKQLDTKATSTEKLDPIVKRLMGWNAPLGAKLQQIIIDSQKVGLRVPHAVTLVSKSLFQAEGLAQQIHRDAKTPQLSSLKQEAMRYPGRRIKGFFLNIADRFKIRRPRQRLRRR